MSELSKAAEALAAGRRNDALLQARNAARGAGSEDLPELARLAAELNDPGLVATVAVRRLRPPRSRRSRIGGRVSSVLVVALGFGWWLGWSLLVTLSTMSNRLGAVLVSTVAAALIVLGLNQGWLETDGESGD